MFKTIFIDTRKLVLNVLIKLTSLIKVQIFITIFKEFCKGLRMILKDIFNVLYIN